VLGQPQNALPSGLVQRGDPDLAPHRHALRHDDVRHPVDGGAREGAKRARLSRDEPVAVGQQASAEVREFDDVPVRRGNGREPAVRAVRRHDQPAARHQRPPEQNTPPPPGDDGERTL